MHLAPAFALRTLLLIAAAAFTTAPARGGLISVNMAVLSSNGAEITTLGQTVVAWNVNGNAVTPPTINGVTFHNAQPSNITVSGFPITGVVNNALTAAHYSSPMNQLMDDMFGTNENSLGSLTFHSLQIGVLYQAQFLHHHDNNSSNRNMNVHFGSVVTPSPLDNTIPFQVGNNTGYITTFLFTADATTQTFLFGNGVGQRAILNGVALTVVPEPSTWLLTACLGIVLAACRKRGGNR